MIKVEEQTLGDKGIKALAPAWIVLILVYKDIDWELWTIVLAAAYIFFAVLKYRADKAAERSLEKATYYIAAGCFVIFVSICIHFKI